MRSPDYRLLRHDKDLYEVAKVTYDKDGEPVTYRSVGQLIGASPRALVGECFRQLSACDTAYINASDLIDEEA